MEKHRHRFPLLSLWFSLLAVLVWLVPGFPDAFQFARTELGSGEIWRVVTGHWAHWNADHLMWDVVVFAVFGGLVECRSRAGFTGVVVGSAMAISAALWCAAPEFEYYRGLSGIDSALFAAFFARLLIGAWRDRSLLSGAVPVLALLGFVGKSVFELTTGSTVFVSDDAFTAVPLAHLAGAAVGVAVAGVQAFRPRAAVRECLSLF